MPDFSRETNSSYNAGVASVRFGSGSKILEVELNELQDIQRKRVASMTALLFKDGVMNVGTYSYSNGTFSLSSESALVGGEFIDIAFLSLGGLVNGNSVYLDVYDSEVTKDSNLKSGGNVQAGNVTNYIADSRYGVETSRRKVLSFTLTKTNGVSGHRYLLLGAITAGAFVKSVTTIELKATIPGASVDTTKLSTAVNTSIADVTNTKNPTGTILPYAGIEAPSNALFCNGDSVLRADYPLLFSALTKNKGTFTANLSSNLFTLNAHGLQTGDIVYLTTTGTLPGLSLNTQYFVRYNDANTFYLCTSLANAEANTTIDINSAQSGVHTLIYIPYGFADATHFNVPDYRGATLVGLSTDAEFNRLHKKYGAKTHTLSADESGIQEHSHTISHSHTSSITGGSHSHPYTENYYKNVSTGGSVWFTHPTAGDFSSAKNTSSADHTHTATVSGTDTANSGGKNASAKNAHNNIQPSAVVNYIIICK